jgi:uncharacterized membrane protein YphA (DoxX/SURF4 family)
VSDTATVGKAAAFNDKTWTQWVGLVLRVVLGGLFIYAGYIKLIHLNTSKNDVSLYRLFPFHLSQTIGLTLPIVEVAVGILLVLGLFTRIAALVTAFLLVVYIAGIISVWARHIAIKCGCFTDAGVVPSWPDAVAGYKKDILRDVLMFLGTLWLVFLPRTAIAVDRWLKGSSGPYDSFDEIDEADDVDADDTEPVA